MPTADETVASFIAAPVTQDQQPGPPAVDSALQVPEPEPAEDATIAERAAAEAEQLRRRAIGAVDRAAAATAPVRDFMARQPTPGGVGILILVLLFLSFVLIPVSPQGRTRAMLLWAMLTGRTRLQGRRDMKAELQREAGTFSDNSGGGDGGGGGSSGFGTDSLNAEQSIPIGIADDEDEYDYSIEFDEDEL
jgi:uncharacterized membrane protein YgcG